ncbi:chloride channel K isoform X5 [Electrophorus electricus]|uniref:chloride channel K isoform X5 n=1 Tax=Electrophorus electricus TaxID=8005 RepID=UPI0015D0452F|nr:chloride channel K isoform X5 [Electrophorus electricus]
MNWLLEKVMENVCISYMSADENKQQAMQNVHSHPEATQEKLIISNECQWKPWKPARSQIRAGCVRRARRAMLSLAQLEWYCYIALGVLTALMSFIMDLTVAKVLRAHQWLYSRLEGNALLQFLCWTLYPACMCALSASFSHSTCPQSAGSGLPEMRTIISGVQMPDYLSLSNLFAKFVGMICTLSAGSTVFLGKVGPFVHLSHMVGAYLHRMYVSASGQNKRRTQGEMLVVASGVGVASCFGAPISETVQALFKTRFPNELPYQLPELLMFALLGLLCGAVSCVYLFSHRWILRFVKTNKFISRFIATETTLYSAVLAFLLALVTFPHFAGCYMASKLTMKQLLFSLLENIQWNSISHNATVIQESHHFSQEWSPPGISVYQTLGCFILIKIWLLVLACTLPLPAGYFMPVFVFGAALGRFQGEVLAYLFPDGISSVNVINPGGYALVGAGAFAGAVTHTLSPALCALEMTGQSTHLIPILIATLISNALSRLRNQPSFYDGISLVKKLPHLPSLLRACPKLSSIQIRQFVVPVGSVLQRGERALAVQHILESSMETDFPVVDTLESPTLLGTVTRAHLQAFLLEDQNQVSCRCLEDTCPIQPVRLQLSTEMTVKQTHCIMSVVREHRLFVTEKGKLRGVITWSEMKKMIEVLAKEV